MFSMFFVMLAQVLFGCRTCFESISSWLYLALPDSTEYSYTNGAFFVKVPYCSLPTQAFSSGLLKIYPKSTTSLTFLCNSSSKSNLTLNITYPLFYLLSAQKISHNYTEFAIQFPFVQFLFITLVTGNSQIVFSHIKNYLWLLDDVYRLSFIDTMSFKYW